MGSDGVRSSHRPVRSGSCGSEAGSDHGPGPAAAAADADAADEGELLKTDSIRKVSASQTRL